MLKYKIGQGDDIHKKGRTKGRRYVSMSGAAARTGRGKY